jgi:hypothetical protein
MTIAVSLTCAELTSQHTYTTCFVSAYSRAGGASAIVLAGVIASLLGTTIVNVALATVSRDLRASVAGVQWVSTGTAPA